jgi:hypothetical protein
MMRILNKESPMSTPHDPQVPPELVKGYRANPPFATLDEFLKATEPSQEKHKDKEKDVAPPEADATEPQPKKKGRCTKKQKSERLATLRSWHLQSASMEQILHNAKTLWGLGRRSVQLYLKVVKQRFADEASREDYLAHQWRSHLQQEQLVFKALKALDRASDVKEVANMLRVAERVIRTRDENMASIQEHRKATKRDLSPDSVKERHKRDGMVVMPFAEYVERMTYCRDVWRQMHQTEFEAMHGFKMRKQEPTDCSPHPTYTYTDDAGNAPKQVFQHEERHYPSDDPEFPGYDVPEDYEVDG